MSIRQWVWLTMGLVSAATIFWYVLFPVPAVAPITIGPEPVQLTERIVDDEHGLTFTYKVGADGYYMEEEDRLDEGEVTTFQRAYRLYSQAARDDQASESQPALIISIFTDPATLDPASWGSGMREILNFEQRLTDPEPITIGEYEAVTFTGDGLYAQDVYVLPQNDRLYVFQAEWIDGESAERSDMIDLLQTVTFFTPAL